MRRSFAIVAVVAVTSSACTDVGSDPNAVVALRFEGSAYPSIVAGDSLRDSLGALQPLVATALNYRNEPVPDATFEFSSPDTVLRVLANGVVFATRRKSDNTPARVFATIGSLQSRPDSLVVVHRADSMDAGKDIEIVPVTSNGGASGADSLRFFIFGDTAITGPPAPVPSWLVSYQLRYKGNVIAPTDTSFAFMFEATTTSPPRRRLITLDTTDAQGKVAPRIFVRSLPSGVTEDTIFLVATIRTRRMSDAPITGETTILLRPASSAVTRP